MPISQLVDKEFKKVETTQPQQRVFPSAESSLVWASSDAALSSIEDHDEKMCAVGRWIDDIP